MTQSVKEVNCVFKRYMLFHITERVSAWKKQFLHAKFIMYFQLNN